MVRELFCLGLLLGGCEWLVPLDGLTGGPPDGGAGCHGDLASDRLNCGACGHSCLGGECSKSRCQPVTIAQDQPGPLGIAVSPHYVFWVNQTPAGLVRAGKDGSGARALVSPTDQVEEPFDIATDADETFVYWSELTKNQVFRKPISGGTKETVGNGGPGQTAFLAVEGGQVYVSDHRPDFGTIATDKVLFHEMDTIAGLAVDGAIVYWGLQTAAKIMAGPISGGDGNGTVAVDAVVGHPMGVAVDQDNIYWIEDGQRLKQAPRRGGASPVLLYESPQAFGDSDVAADGAAIYWTEHGTGATGVVRKLAR
jgi:hypothetical protein